MPPNAHRPRKKGHRLHPAEHADHRAALPRARRTAIGITEEQLLATLRSLSERGIIRRFGATLRHQRTGYTANAMAAWKVEEDRIETVGPHDGRLPAGVPLLPPQPVPRLALQPVHHDPRRGRSGLPCDRAQMALAAAIDEYTCCSAARS